MKPHGDLTAQIGEHLCKDLAPRGYDVVHDHGTKAPHVGEIVSWFGSGPKPALDTRLSELDIAVIDQRSHHTVALIEIEETNDRPKTILGDAFAVLMGNGIWVHEAPLAVGSYTTLIVMVCGPESHRPRIDQLTANITASQSALSGNNRSIGVVVVDTYDPDEMEQDLYKKLPAHIEAAIARSLPSPA